MRLKHGYLALCFLGGLLPLRHIVLFFNEHGFDTAEFIRQIYATRIGAFFTADVTASLVVLIVFVIAEGRRAKMPRYWTSFLGLVIGVSLALPLFLYLREQHLEDKDLRLAHAAHAN
jgi:hypothetical protein